MAGSRLLNPGIVPKGEVAIWGSPPANHHIQRHRIRLSESDPTHTSGVPDWSGRVPLSHVHRPEQYEGIAVALATRVIDEVLSS